MIVRSPQNTIVNPIKTGNAALTTPVLNNVSSSILAANPARVGLIIENPPTGTAPTQRVFVFFGTPASATDWTVTLDPGDVYEMPASPVYTGEITAILNSAGPRNINVTEITEP